LAIKLGIRFIVATANDKFIERQKSVAIVVPYCMHHETCWLSNSSFKRRFLMGKKLEGIKLYFKTNAVDSDMVDLYTIGTNGRRLLWAVVYIDLFLQNPPYNRSIYNRLEREKVLKFNLEEIKE